MGEEPERTSCLHNFVTSKKFETLCSLVIMVNSCFIIYITDNEIQHLHDPIPSPARTLDNCFMVFYVLELLMKLAAHRQYFFCNRDCKWNILDFLLVLISIPDNIIWLVLG